MDARVKPAHDESRITAVGITFYLYDSSGSGPSLKFGGMDAMNEASAPAATVDPAMTRGPAAAPVTILEWSDFQCTAWASLQ